jgi:hypothetical protein
VRTSSIKCRPFTDNGDPNSRSVVFTQPWWPLVWLKRRVPHCYYKGIFILRKCIIIGTQKSLPTLEKVLGDESFMVNGNARKALPIVKSRQGQSLEHPRRLG